MNQNAVMHVKVFLLTNEVLLLFDTVEFLWQEE